MATIAFDQVMKQFENGTVAVSDLTLDVHEGEFLILVGPSGCGKTTALRMVAGLEEVSGGSIRIGDVDATHLPPVERDVAMVFQNYALYPHMTVEENLVFPLRQKRIKRAEARRRAREVASLLAIEELLERKPRQLSGGQRQRVAIGRALVRRPKAFLMDEPLSNLDAKLRVQMRAELLALHREIGITTVYVTHDQTEAMTLGDRVVVMNKGVVQQVAPPKELYRQPANTFVAGFIGSPSMNFLRGRVDGGALRVGPQLVELDARRRSQLGDPRDVVVGVRPEDFQLANGSGFDADVAFVESLGPESLVHFRAPGFEILQRREQVEAGEEDTAAFGELLVARFVGDVAPSESERLRLAIAPQRISLFDPATGAALQ